MEFMVRAYLTTLFLLFAFAFSGMPAYAQYDGGRYVDTRLVTEKNKIESGDTVIIAIEQTIYPDWHTYWINPGDSGEPTTIKWDMPEGFDVSPIKWPVPEAIEIGPLVNYGYKDKVILLQELHVPYDLPEGPVTLDAEIMLLVCEEICIPETSSHSISFNTEEDATDNTDYINDAYKKLPMEVDWHSWFSETDGGRFQVTIEPDFPAALKTIQPQTLDLLPIDWGIVAYDKPAEKNIGERILTIKKDRGDRPLSSFDTLKGLITYTDRRGNDTALLFTAYPDPDWKEALQNQADSTAEPAEEQTASPFFSGAASTTDVTFLTALLFALLGGVILNLMPCVFPILSMKALSLCEMKGHELKVARRHGLFYTGGILATFALIAGLLLALRAGGSAIGWGFQLQNPMVVLVLAWLFFIITLNLAGFFNVNILLGKTGRFLTQKEGYTGSFMTGILATIVATPCTAPFMGAALGYAIIQPAAMGMGIFMALGLGLALPYLALSFFPSLQKILPKPGPWMEKFRHILAIPMGAAVIWLVWVYDQQTGSLSIPLALGGMITLTVAIWVIKSSQGQRNGNTMAVFLALLLAVVTFKAGHQYSTQPFTPEIDVPFASEKTVAFSPDALEALLAGNEPVFVNMTAAWCITCKVNEKAVLASKRTTELFKAHDVTYVVGDWTNQNSDITGYLSGFDRNGVPLYVYYGPRGEKTGKRPEPVMLPQILTPSIMERTITKGEKDS